MPQKVLKKDESHKDLITIKPKSEKIEQHFTYQKTNALRSTKLQEKDDDCTNNSYEFD